MNLKKQQEFQERNLKKQQKFQERLAGIPCFKLGSIGHVRSNCPMQLSYQCTTTCEQLETPGMDLLHESLSNETHFAENLSQQQLAKFPLNHADKSKMDHTEIDCVDVDVETVVPESAEVVSYGDLTDNSVHGDDEASNSSKVGDLGSESMVACLMMSSDEVLKTCDDAVVVNTCTFEDEDEDSWDLEEVLSRAPWKNVELTASVA